MRSRELVGRILRPKLLTITAVILVLTATGASAQEFTWMRQFGGPGIDQANDTATSSEAVYVVGQIDSTPSKLGFVRRYEPQSGTLLWEQRFGNSGESTTAVSVAVADEGEEIYVVGNTAQNGAWLLKYTGNGTALWSRHFGGAGVSVSDVALNGGNEPYVSGFSHPFQVGFVHKYSPSGTLIGIFDHPGVEITSLAFDAIGSTFFIAGYPATDSSNRDIHVGRVSATVPMQWIRGIHIDVGGGDALTTSIAVDADDNPVIVGATTVRLGDMPIAGSYDAFIIRLNGNNMSDNRKQTFGSPAFDAAWAVDADATDLFVAGSTLGTIPGGQPQGSKDGWVKTFRSRTGDPLSTHQFGTAEEDEAFGLAVSPVASNVVYIAGSTWGTLPGQASFGGSDAYLAELLISTCGAGGGGLGSGGAAILNPTGNETGPVSGPVHDLDRSLSSTSPILREVVHEANCDVVVTAGL